MLSGRSLGPSGRRRQRDRHGSETQQRSFEPFFTSKEVGHGTGLGLPMVLGFVDQSGGSVRVRSRPGQGSTFSLLLPLAEVSVGGAAASDSRADDPIAVRKGSGTVLLVEDEAILRLVAARTLTAAGYTVLSAADGPDALHLASLHAGVVDLLFADLVMPGMRGTELAASLLETRPGAKVLLTSGYTAEDVSRRGIELGEHRLLPKPYTPAALTAAIAEVLGEG